MTFRPIHAVAIILSLILLSQSMFVLDQRQSAIILQFGEFVRSLDKPGLKFKVPFIQNVIFFDHRVQNLTADTTEVIASDQKTMRVDAFTKYKIIDPLRFFQRAKDERNFKARLSPIIDSSLRQVLGSVPFKALLTPDRTILMGKIKDIVNVQSSDFGVQIIDVRITRADLPELSRNAVFERMISERGKEAKEIRAEGSESAQIIIATADKDRTILVAEAKKRAEIIRGEGDSEAIKLYGRSFGQDPEFYDFYKSMETYRTAIGGDNSKLVVSPDNEFFKYLKRN